MPIFAASSSYEPHPDGQFAARCVDIVDLGSVHSAFYGKTQHKIRILFWADQKNSDGRPLYVGRRFTLSLHEKASLRSFLEGWRGKKFTKEELRGFDVETLLGAPAYISVAHDDRGDETYANVHSAMKLPKGEQPPSMPADYVRMKDRPKENGNNPGEREPGMDDDLDPLPF